GPPRTHRPAPTVPAITPGDLMTRLYIFADDSMQGREAGTIGNVKGTDYIADEIKRAGLVPAGDGGTYFQTIPVAREPVARDCVRRRGGRLVRADRAGAGEREVGRVAGARKGAGTASATGRAGRAGRRGGRARRPRQSRAASARVPAAPPH